MVNMPQGPVMSRLTSLGPRCRAINKSKGLPIPATLPWVMGVMGNQIESLDIERAS